MREIEFRAKTKAGNWIYGMPTFDFEYIINAGQYDSPDNYEVDPKTIGQYIGIKDINNKKIFEGDIVKAIFKHKEFGKNFTAVVEWHPIQPFFVMKHKLQEGGHDCFEYDFSMCGMLRIEKLGNIHDNPELLEK